MCGGSSTTTSTVSPPPEVLAQYTAVNNAATQAAQQPFTPYSTDPNAFVAPINQTQQAGIYGTNVASTMAQPFYGQATNQLMGAQQAATPFYGAAAQNVTNSLANAQPYQQTATNLGLAGTQAVNPYALGSNQINQYMSPYLNTVLQGTAGILNQQNQQQQAGQMGNAIRQGAFGGDRAGIAAANLAQQQQLANSQIFSGILNQGYNNALNTAGQQQQLSLGAAQANRAALQQGAQQMLGIGQQGFNQGLTAAQQQQALGQGIYGMGSATSQQLAALGTGAQSAGLQGAQAQLAAGQVQQQTDQAARTALYNQFLQQQSYPFQVAQFRAGIAEGTGAASGATTTSTQPGGLFSDRRLKENVEPIGKTFDGQPIYKYNYKGDDTTQIGLMAQNVEKHHPEAVGLAGGYKTVNYDKATADAAKRGHFATGGLASMGGGVMPEHSGQGFADGGYASYGGIDPDVLAHILAVARNMYEPINSVGSNAQGTITGRGINIPTSGGVAPAAAHTLTPADLPKQASATDQANSLIDTATKAEGLGKDLFSKKKKGDPNTDDDMDWSDFFKAKGGVAGKADGGSADGEDDQEEISPLDLDQQLMKGIKPGVDKRGFLQQLMEESDANNREEAPTESSEKVEAAAPAPVDAALNVASKATSSASEEKPLQSKIAKMEGTGKNPKSSAVGKYQIVNDTFVGYFKKLHPGEAKGMSDKQILALRNSPRANALYEEMGPAISADNKATLRSANLPANDANVYALHFLGPKYGPAVLKADPNASVESVVPASFVSSNPSVLKGKTVAQVRDWLQSKMLARGGVAGRHGYAAGGDADLSDMWGTSSDWTDTSSDDEKKREADAAAAAIAAKAVTGKPENLIPENFGSTDLGGRPQVLTAEQAKPIQEKAIETRTIDPRDAAALQRSAPKTNIPGLLANADVPIAQENAAPTGVAAGTQAPAATPEQKKESLGHRIFHADGRTDYLVPILSGLAGAITAPTRNPFQALAYGLGVGTSGLQKQREFDLQKQMVGVRSGEAAANLMGKAINLYRPNPDTATNTQFPWVDAGNRLITDAQRAQSIQGVVSMMGTGNRQWSPEAFKGVLQAGLAPGSVNTPPVGAANVPQVPTGVTPPTAPKTPKVQPSAKPAAIPANVEDRAAAGTYRLPQPTTPLDYNGLGDSDNPAKLRAFYNQNIGSANSQIADRAKAMLDRANKIDAGEIPVNVTITNPDGTASSQAWNGWQQRKSDVDRYQSLRDAATEAAGATNTWSETFSQNRDRVLNVFQKLAQASADANLNRGANYKANFIGYVSSIPGLSELVPESYRKFQSAADEGDKYSAAQQIMVDVENKLTRAPAAGLAMAQRMAPGVTTAPFARYSYITDNVAKILQDDAFNEFWSRNKNNIEDVSRARQDWYNQNPLSKYMRKAIDQTPFSAGMPQDDMLKLISHKAQPAPVYKNGQLQTKNGQPVMGNTIVYYPTADQKAALPDGAYFMSNGNLVIKGARRKAP